jgi:hypothetical protein
MGTVMQAALVQFAIAAFGLTAIVMAMSDHVGARRWAPVVGLAGQPFWAIFAVGADAYGVVLLTIAYTGAYLVGFNAQWRPLHWWRHYRIARQYTDRRGAARVARAFVNLARSR